MHLTLYCSSSIDARSSGEIRAMFHCLEEGIDVFVSLICHKIGNGNRKSTPRLDISPQDCIARQTVCRAFIANPRSGLNGHVAAAISPPIIQGCNFKGSLFCPSQIPEITIFRENWALRTNQERSLLSLCKHDPPGYF